MDPESVWILGTRLGHMDEKLTCNEPLMYVSVPSKEIWSPTCLPRLKVTEYTRPT